jgi:hypothetical protein
MRKRLVTMVSLLALVALAALTVATSPASAAAGAGSDDFAAGIVRLDGGQEVPAADPDGRGTFAYIAFGDDLCYFLSARRIEPAAAAHIHAGARGVNGGIVVGLKTPTQRGVFDCIQAVDNTTPDGPTVLLQSELDAIIDNPAGFYANVHNAEFPAGAVRGQLR